MLRECYLSSLKTVREELAMVNAHPFEVPNIDFKGLDLRLDAWEERLMPMENLKEIQIGPHTHQVTKIGTPLSAGEERELVDQLRKNFNLFTWTIRNAKYRQKIYKPSPCHISLHQTCST